MLFQVVLVTVLSQAVVDFDESDKNPIAEQWSSKGYEFEMEAAYDQAISAYSKAIEIAPSCTVGYVKRGRCYVAKKDLDHAISDFTKAITHRERSVNKPFYARYVEPFLERGSAYEMKKDYEMALADFSKAIACDPENALSFDMRAALYISRGGYEKAIADCTDAIRLGRDLALMTRGYAYLMTKDHASARTDFEELIRHVPGLPHAYLSRGLLHRCEKNFEMATRDFTHAIELDPQCPEASGTLAHLLATCPEAAFRDGVKAVSLARKAFKLSNWEDVLLLQTLAAAYAESGKYDQAIKWQEKAIDLGFDDDEHVEKANYLLDLYRQRKPYRGEKEKW